MKMNMKKRIRVFGWVCLLGLVWAVGGNAQRQPVNAEPEAPGKAGSGTGVSPVVPTAGVSLPRLVKFTGLLKDRLGQPRTGVVGVTFTLYQDQQGGAPLWLEVQNLELDEQGRYTVLLGATQTGGLPLELFAAGRARWLGMQVQGEEESPEASGRILLVSVPYALKAADAETLGGKPASAFVLSDEAGLPRRSLQGEVVGVSPVSLLSGPGSTKEQVTGTGTTNFLAKFTSTGPNPVVGNSLLFDDGTKVGLGTTTPAVKFQVNVTNPFAGTVIGSSALSVGSVDIVTTDAQGANVGPLLVLGGNRATTGTNLGVFGGIRGAKENSTDGNTAGYLGFYTLQAGVGFGERMRISSTGLVGMGTLSPNPGVRLTLVGGLHMRGAVADLSVPDGENLQLGHLNALGGLFTERLRITPTGNVGIGTTAPGQKLEVLGNLKLSGTGSGLIFPDATTQTTAAITQTAADTRYAQLAAANTFTANQTFTTGSFSGNTDFTILSVTQNGSGIGVAGGATSGVGVKGSTGTGTGVEGGGGGSGSVGVFGFVNTTGGITGHVGVKGLVGSDGSPGSGIAGLFHNRTGGKILSGLTGGFPGTEVFSVGGDGTVSLRALGTADAAQGFNSGALEQTASAFNTTTSAAENQTFRWLAEPLGNNTPTPSAKLSLLFGSGATAPATTGLSINANGTIIFASGQVFPVSGTGDITAVNTPAAGGLIGGAVSGDVTLSVANNGVTGAMIADGNITDVDIAPGAAITPNKILGTAATLDAPNTFTADQTFTTGSFSGDNGTQIVRVTQSGTLGNAVAGYATATTGFATGVVGTTAGAFGVGVYGNALATTGFATGVVGTSSSTTGTGVRGSATASTGNNYGGYFESSSSGGNGIRAVSPWVGGFFDATAVLGVAVWGESRGTTGSGHGGFFRSVSVSGTGVRGQASATSGAATGVVGESSSTSGTGVKGLASATTGIAYGVYGGSSSSTGSGVIGVVGATTGSAYGVEGQSFSTSGVGVFGSAYASTGTTYGVFGRSRSSSGFGVYGEAVSGNGTGVYGLATATTLPNIGVVGESPSTQGTGVWGKVTATTGSNIGVRGTSSGGSQSVGVFGEALATTGITAGVKGTTSSTSGVGVYGLAPAPNGDTYGVWGVSYGTSGVGVVGEALATSGNAYGLYGTSSSTGGVGVYGLGQAFGVYGISGGGYAVYSQGNAYVAGNLYVTGILSKSSGTFKIDHPLDPANKYLSHSFVESPDMMNIYNGNAVLGDNGEAWVELPTYFAALNRDFRYQLTCIGGFAPVYVADEVENNRFRIAGGRPGMKVSWQVTGIRQDAYAEAHRIKVEEEKSEKERGLYFHPELYGQPKEKGIQYAHRPPAPPAATKQVAQSSRLPRK